MDKIIDVGQFKLVYTNFRYRDMTTNERYEGWMRSDFTTHKLPKFDSFEIVFKRVDN